MWFLACHDATARICSALPPRTSMRFRRPRWPEAILTAASGTFKQSAKKRRRASLARPSTGGTLRRTRRAPCHSPSISLRLARGWTRTRKLNPPWRSRISIIGYAVRQRGPCRCESAWRLPRWRTRNRATFPWTIPATRNGIGARRRRASRAAAERRGVLAAGRPSAPEPSSGRAVPNEASGAALPQAARAPRGRSLSSLMLDRAALRSARASGGLLQRRDSAFRPAVGYRANRWCERGEWPALPCSFAGGRPGARWPPSLRRRAPSTPIPGPGFRRNDECPIQRLRGFVPRGTSWIRPRWLRRKLCAVHERRPFLHAPEGPRHSLPQRFAKFPFRGF